MSKDREELRIARAKALCAASGDDWFREGPKGLIEAYGPLVDADTSAIEAAGFVVVPREPTEAMCQSAAKAGDDYYLGDAISWDEIPIMYRAMINAYSPKTSGGDAPPPTQSEEP